MFTKVVWSQLSRRQKEQALETAKRMEKMPLFSGGLTTPEQNRALIDQLNKELEREDIIAMGFDPRWLALSRKQGLLTEEEKTEARAAAEQLAAQPLQVRYQEAQRAAGASPYGQIPAMLSFERSMTPEETELFKAQYALGTALADRAGMSGPFAAAAGLVSALPGASWADREGTKAQQAMTPKPFRSPLTPEGWSPYTQAREEHPVAYGAGAVAGNVGVTLAGGKLADAAVKTTPLLRHLPKAAQTVLSTGLNFGGQAALRTAENGGDAGQIVKAGVTNALAGMAGQGVGQMVHGGAVKLLGHLNLSNSIPANVAASATEGVSFAGTQMGTRMLLDEDYRPSGGEAAVDLTSAAAFSALSRYLQTRAQSKEAAVRLQADAEDMKRDFQRIANNVYVNGPEATLDDLELKIARTRGAINANTYMGQQETVNAINEFLDTLDEAISMKRLELGAIPGTAVDAGSVTGAPAYGWEAPAFTPHSESTNGGGGYLMGLVPEIPPRPVQQSPRDILSRLAWEMAAGDDPLGDLAKDDMLAILDQIARRQSGEVTEQTDKAEPLILAENELLPTEENGTMLSETVSGALNPTGKAAREHAKRYYGLIRKMKTDVARIAKNTGYGSDQIMQIKQYLFFDSHILSGGKRERFAPDYDMAQSWKRLLEGVDIQEHDLTLLKHEMMEMELVASGMSQAEAHKRTSAIYNYAKEVEEYNDRIKKYKDQR